MVRQSVQHQGQGVRFSVWGCACVGEGANGNKLLCAAELWKERQNTEQKASDHQICYLHLPEIISFLIVIAIV
jgi:hypothetical protein